MSYTHGVRTLHIPGFLLNRQDIVGLCHTPGLAEKCEEHHDKAEEPHADLMPQFVHTHVGVAPPVCSVFVSKCDSGIQ